MIEKLADGRTDLVYEVIESGTGANALDENGVSLIKWCAYYGDVSAIKYLLLNGEKLESLGENLGLGSAVFHGHLNLCQFLLESGADVNHVNGSNTETLLHTALCKANRPVYELIVELLIHHGISVNTKTQQNKDTGGFMRAVRTKGETPLHRAAAFGSQKMVKMLLAAGADIKAEDMNGDTPLAWASWHLRPPAILRELCFDNHSIHPDNLSTYDHGQGWGTIDYPMSKLHLS